MEEWKIIEDFPNYEISCLGQVRRGDKILTPFLQRNGYFQVSLRKNKKQYTKTIHRLVAQSFLPNSENKPCIDHLNRNRADNRVENLRWATHSENARNQGFKETNTGHHHISKTKNNFFIVKYLIDNVRFQKHFKNLEEAIAWRDDNLPAPFEN